MAFRYAWATRAGGKDMNYRLGRKAAWAVVLVCALASLTLCIGCKEAPIPMSLSVDTSDAVTTYRVGSTLDTGGIVAKLRMNDGTDKPVDARELHYACDLNHTGQQEVTATYNGLSDKFMIFVEAENGSLDLATGPWDLMVAAEGDILRSYRVTAMYTDRQGRPTLVSGISPEVHMTLDGKVVEDGYELKAEDHGRLFTVEYKGVHTRGRTLTVLPLLPATGMKVRTVDSRDREYRAGEKFRYPSNLWVDISYDGSGETRTVNLVDEGGDAAEGVVFLIDGTEISPDGYEFAESQGGTTVPVTVRYEKVKAGTVRPMLERGLVPFEDSEYLECSYDVVVKEAATVQSVSVTRKPDRVSYAGTGEDAKLNLRGLEVTAYMSDGTTKLVKWTDEEGNNGVTTVPADGAVITKDQDVKVTYGGKETTYKVTYTKDRELSSIRVLTKPDKTDYDKGEAFTAEGLSVRATYDDGSWNIVRYEDETDKFSFSPISVGTDVTENKTITVTYTEGGKSPTATFPVTYQKPRKVTGIEIVNKDQYQVTLTVGDTYRAPTSVLVKVTYDDDTSDIRDAKVSGTPVLDRVGTFSMTASYTDPNYPDDTECTDIYTVTVAEAATVQAISIARKPDRMSYTGTDDEAKLNLAGLEVTVYMSDGTTKHVKWTIDNANGISTTPGNGAGISSAETVTVKYGDRTTKFDVSYTLERKLDSMTVLTPPGKTNYSDGEKFTAEGLTLLATYDDGSQNVIRYSSDDTGFSFTSGLAPFTEGMDVTGDKTIQIKYENKSVGIFGITYKVPKKVTRIEIVDKYKYEVTLPAGTISEKPKDMSVRVYYNDGTVDVKKASDEVFVLECKEGTPLIEGHHTMGIIYSAEKTIYDTYTVYVVVPTIGDVMIASADLVQVPTSNHATGKNPVSLDDLVNRVIFSSDVKGATYTYKYETLGEMQTGTVTADAHLTYASVDIPASQDLRTIYLMMVEKEGYKDYTATVDGKPLEPISGEVSMTLDQGTDNTDWKLSLSSTVGTKIQYRRNKGDWIDYRGEEFEIFDSSVPDDVSVVVVQARALDSQGNQVSNTFEAKYERVSVRFEYGYMNGLEPDLPYTAANKALGRYPTITAIAPEGCEISAILDEKFLWNDGYVESTSYPSKKNVLKFLATWNETETTVRAYAIDPTGERMNWGDGHYYSSNPMTWIYDSENPNYSVGGPGPMGGIIVDDRYGGYAETVVPDRLKEPWLLVCGNARKKGSYTVQQLVDLEHSCGVGERCQLWTLTHPFGEDGPVNIVSQMGLRIYGSDQEDYNDWLTLCKTLIGDIGDTSAIVIPYFEGYNSKIIFETNGIKFTELTYDTSQDVQSGLLPYGAMLPLVGKNDNSGNINMISLYNSIGQAT